MNIKPGDRIRLIPPEVVEVVDSRSVIIVRYGSATGPLFAVKKEWIEEVIPAPRRPFAAGDRVRTHVGKDVLEILSISYIQNQEWAWCWRAEGGSPISVRTDELRSEPKP